MSQTLEISYGEVFFNKLYHNRSVVIVNSSDVSLDFMLSSNVPHTELNFSLSATSLKEISSISVDAHSRLQVFLYFRPMLPSEREISRGAPSSATEIWNREVEVYINCRLVKDFQETVTVRASCCHPQLKLRTSRSVNPNEFHLPDTINQFSLDPSSFGIVFTAAPRATENASNGDTKSKSIQKQGSPIAFQYEDADAQRYLIVSNVRDTSVQIAVRNDTMFFLVELDHIHPSVLSSPHRASMPASASGVVVGALSLEGAKCDVLPNYIPNGSAEGLLFAHLRPREHAVFRILPNFETLALNEHT